MKVEGKTMFLNKSNYLYIVSRVNFNELYHSSYKYKMFSLYTYRKNLIFLLSSSLSNEVNWKKS